MRSPHRQRRGVSAARLQNPLFGDVLVRRDPAAMRHALGSVEHAQTLRHVVERVDQLTDFSSRARKRSAAARGQ
jgi:hypothetical protein